MLTHYNFYDNAIINIIRKCYIELHLQVTYHYSDGSHNIYIYRKYIMFVIIVSC